MQDRRIPGLPEMERRDQETIQAFAELQTVWEHCGQELQQARENFARLAEERQKLEEWSGQLGTVYQYDSQHLEPERRHELYNLWIEAQQALRKINQTMRTLHQEILELEIAMASLRTSHKKIEVAEA